MSGKNVRISLDKKMKMKIFRMILLRSKLKIKFQRSMRKMKIFNIIFFKKTKNNAYVYIFKN